MPVPWIQVLFGVSQRAIVNRKPPWSPSSCVHCWTVPLPYVVEPTIVARPRSWSAPATISEADAEPPSTSTTSRIAGSVAAPPGSTRVSVWFPCASCSQKIVPSARNWLAMSRAAVTNPPGLPRRSTISWRRPAATFSATTRSNSSDA